MKLWNTVRPYVGGVALFLGGVCLFFFVLGMPIISFGAPFFAGLGFREGPQPSHAQVNEAISHQVEWSITHRLAPLLAASAALLLYGLYEMRHEQKQRAQQ